MKTDPVSELIAHYEALSLASTTDPRLTKSTPYHNAYVKSAMASDMVLLQREVKKLRKQLNEMI